MAYLLLLCLLLTMTSCNAFSTLPTTFRGVKRTAPAFSAVRLNAGDFASGAVLERPGSTVLSRPTILNPIPSQESKNTKAKGWELRIFNDTTNTREHVARTLVQVTNKSESDAYNLMMSAHKNGLAVVGVFLLEQAEMFCEQLGEFGLVADIQPLDE
ncbi:hypothetical protein TrLO_g11490 [Triparma laevis f. longispina]|uniref:Adaptor protein ClpS core domain-containing protein n=1 Tax=Triparma laevis f. longispina TaxID=1714387 RepID=A0A9W7CDI8_9STRA|nr:hypothetical protein TrLO_g11490 [Triparma laevis f. longispina]